MVDYKPRLSEADVKLAVAEHLTYLQNQGKLWFERLNTGEFFLTDSEGKFRRRVKGAKKGTADFIVIQPSHVRTYLKGQRFLGEPHPIAMVTFIETKSRGGKQTREQLEFEQTAKAMRCRYFVVKDADEVKSILEWQ